MKKIIHKEIEDIYNKHITINFTDEYKNRYNPLPFEKNNKKWKWEGKDFPRVISLLEFERYIEKYNFQINNLLIFNGIDDPELEYLNDRVKTIHNINYEDDTTNNDLHYLNLDRKDYDFVCLHQTLEHVYNPQQCLMSIYNHMKDGGYLYINVPACNIPHSEPYHYFMGYTPMGLATIAYQVGFKILEIGQWGNREYMLRNWAREPGWPEYRHLRSPGLNEIHNPVITWGLFIK
jgi:SAM-dependent methyltransferase